MICRSCLLRRAAGVNVSGLLKPIASRGAGAGGGGSRTAVSPFTTSAARLRRRAEPEPSAPTEPTTITPTVAPWMAGGGDRVAAAAAVAEGTESLSSCPAGTVLNGLNYIKGKSDPVALADEAYPPWLWDCLEVQNKKAGEVQDVGAGDEFSKSKKQRRLASKRKAQQEAKLLASGNLEALVPEIPLPAQSINLPTNLPSSGDGSESASSVSGALFAASKREELRKALRQDRKAKIKESNYLKTM